jgi:hypothetical protein
MQSAMSAISNSNDHTTDPSSQPWIDVSCWFDWNKKNHTHLSIEEMESAGEACLESVFEMFSRIFDVEVDDDRPSIDPSVPGGLKATLSAAGVDIDGLSSAYKAYDAAVSYR